MTTCKLAPKYKPCQIYKSMLPVTSVNWFPGFALAPTFTFGVVKIGWN